MNEEKQLRAQRHNAGRREVRHLVRELLQRIKPGEHLGTPHREANRIVIPVMQEAREGDGVGEDDSLRALLSAWLDRPTLG